MVARLRVIRTERRRRRRYMAELVVLAPRVAATPITESAPRQVDRWLQAALRQVGGTPSEGAMAGVARRRRLNATAFNRNDGHENAGSASCRRR